MRVITMRPSGGTYTLHIGDQWATYDHNGKLVETSEPELNWALTWANYQAVAPR